MNGSILDGRAVLMRWAHLMDCLCAGGRRASEGRVPVNRVLAQGVLACLLAKSGTFDQLTDYGRDRVMDFLCFEYARVV